MSGNDTLFLKSYNSNGPECSLGRKKMLLYLHILVIKKPLCSNADIWDVISKPNTKNNWAVVVMIVW